MTDVTHNAKRTEMWNEIKRLRTLIPAKTESPVDVVKKEKKKVTVAVAQEVQETGVEKLIFDLKNNSSDFIDSYAKKLVNYAEQVSDVEAVIDIRKKELEDIAGVMDEYISMADTISCHNILKSEYKLELDDIKKTVADFKTQSTLEVKTMLIEASETAKNTVDAAKISAKEITSNANIAEKRRAEQWEYDFKLKIRNLTQAKKDEVELLSSDLDIAIESFTNEKAKFGDLKKINDDLATELDAVPELIKDAIKKAEGRKEGMLTSKHTNEIAGLKKDFLLQESENKNKIIFLERALESANERIKELTTSVASAQKSSTDIALKMASAGSTIIQPNQSK